MNTNPDIHARSGGGRTQLHEAAEAGQEARVRRLIALGAEVDARCEFDVTPLMEAVYSASMGCARLLLAAGADPNAQDSCSDTALHHACGEDMQHAYGADALAFVRLLLAHGADPNLAGMQGQTPLHHAVSAAEAECLLAAGADPGAEDVDGWTPLHGANVEVSRVLIAHGADIHAGDQADFTPLYWAGSPEKIHLLLEAGARLTEGDYWSAALFHNRSEGELDAWLRARGSSLAEIPDTPEIRQALAEGRRRA